MVMKNRSLSNNNREINVVMMMKCTSEGLGDIVEYLSDNYEDLPGRDDSQTLEFIKNLRMAANIINNLTKKTTMAAISNRMTLSYDMNGTLTEALKVALDMGSETGMEPRCIHDAMKNKDYDFNHNDALAVVNDKMSEDDYIIKHVIQL